MFFMLKSFFHKLFSRFNDQSKNISSAAVIIGSATLAAKILGILRDRVLAGEFGASKTLDIYYASFRIPDLVYNLLVLGTISAGFIPVFSDYIKKDIKEAWKLANTILTILFVALSAVLLVLMIFTEPIMKLLAPGFAPADMALTTKITRIMFLSPLLLGLSGIFSSVLQTYKRFFITSLAPIVYNVGIIFGAIFLVPRFGINGLAWGVVLGACLHLFIQIPSMISLGYSPRWIFDLKNAGMATMVKLMIPRFLGLALNQLNLVIVTIIGSTLASGSLAIFNFANNLQSFPLGLFAISYAVAAFPTLSEYADDKKKFIASFSLTLRQILFFIIPSSAILIILRAQVVRVALGSGSFDWNDTRLTFDTLAFFVLSLFAQSLIPLISRALYALKDSMTPFYVGFVSTGLNIFLSLIFVKYSSHIGLEGEEIGALALAFSISSIFNVMVLWLLLKIKMGELDEASIFKSTLKIAIASFCMGAVVQGLKYALEPFFGTQTFIGVALQGGISGVVGIITYLTICVMLKSEEAIIFFSSIQKRLFKKYIPRETIDSSS
ncbi:MAG: Integral membrane protein MviN [Parcubacteria group bacterium GW2011_GWA2_38_13]|nr:MAG: Integral membrane protein MviN [Parcubacteria group bacterium GW2011_GWA2_38_13]